MSTAWYLLLAYVVGFWMYSLWLVVGMNANRHKVVVADELRRTFVVVAFIIVGMTAAFWPIAVVLDTVAWVRKKRRQP